MLCLNLLVKEDLSTLAKPLFALCCQITAGAPLRHHGLHLGMALKITLQAVSRIVAAILENNQTPEGIRVPKVLVPYCGFDMIDDKNF